ncbi:hypothetical protein NDU88_005086 [Pleurodeles waltl]|uniref:Uncharacterized protein n=1 Tax=Pleurodeles waltl TaxID=8319 RepID=A0AAV7UIY2_PLEWA|nr:hypothetical protein NDU88_005086 [Pleurodeles waltl]
MTTCSCPTQPSLADSGPSGHCGRRRRVQVEPWDRWLCGWDVLAVKPLAPLLTNPAFPGLFWSQQIIAVGAAPCEQSRETVSSLAGPVDKLAVKLFGPHEAKFCPYVIFYLLRPPFNACELSVGGTEDK